MTAGGSAAVCTHTTFVGSGVCSNEWSLFPGKISHLIFFSRIITAFAGQGESVQFAS